MACVLPSVHERLNFNEAARTIFSARRGLSSFTLFTRFSRTVNLKYIFVLGRAHVCVCVHTEGHAPIWAQCWQTHVPAGGARSDSREAWRRECTGILLEDNHVTLDSTAHCTGIKSTNPVLYLSRPIQHLTWNPKIM